MSSFKSTFIKLILSTLTMVLAVGCTSKATKKEDLQLQAIFATHLVKGTLILSSDKGTQYQYHIERSQKPFLPASTFKIPNTLIALDEGVVQSADDVFQWDGKQRELPVWNQNLTLRQALPASCVWCYQQIASQVGLENYKKHMKKMSYGNQQLGDLTTFWLQGDIRISAHQQIEFLKRLYHETLPYKKEHQQLTKSLMQQDKNQDYTLYAKTGLVGFGEESPQKIGWFVGFIETQDDVWFFALNIDVEQKKHIAMRKQIVLEALIKKGIIPETSV